MIFTQAQAKELHATNAKLRAAANMPPRKPIVGCIGQKAILEIHSENAKLAGGSKKPVLDALVKSYQANPNGTADDHLAAVAKGLPSAAAPINAATPQGSAAAIASAIVDETERRAAAAKQLTKAEFDLLDARQKGDFFRNGGKMIEATAAPVRKSSTPGAKTLAEFSTMSQPDKHTFFAAGGKLEA